MKNESGKKPKTASTGKSYVFVSYLFVILFAGMIVYMVYFQLVKSEELQASPYNRHQELYSRDVVRGSILALSGDPVAYTETNEEGNEYRVYPYGRLFAHTVGYSDYGAAGLEATQNSVLLQSHEGLLEQVENDLNDQKNYADNLVSTLYPGISTAAYEALGDRKGAVIVLDANSGKVRACISKPDFDPNTVYEDWEALNTEDSGSPFLNRALQGLYEPGSTFKMVTALAFIHEHPDDWSDFTFECTGEYTAGSYTMHCSNGAVHGQESLADAFANSCNCAFSYIATQCLSDTALKETAERLGFNRNFITELPTSVCSFELENQYEDGLTMQTAIGQGDTMASPLQMALIAQAVYHDGVMMRPGFISHILSSSGTMVEDNMPVELGRVMSSGEATIMKQLMRAVVERGTAGALTDLPWNICGKTGTAEYDNDEGYSHSWFVGFSNTGQNDIVVAVIVEEAGPDESPAQWIARACFERWFS